MSHALLFDPAASQTEAPSFHQGVRALGDFKGVQITDSATLATASLAVAPATSANPRKSGVRPRLIQQLANDRMNIHNYANLYIARLI